MRSIAVIIMLCFLPVVLSSQVEISPARIDFGEVGTSLVGATYYEAITITNTSAEDLLLDVWFVNHGEWNVALGTLVPFRIDSQAVAPNKTLRLSFQMAFLGWGPTPFLTYKDSIWVGVRRKGQSVKDRQVIPVPVSAKVIEADRPFVSAEKGLADEFCRCFIPEDTPPNSSIETLEFLIFNPYSPTNTDTLWVDSLQIEEVNGNGIPAGRVQEKVNTYDTVAPYDWMNGQLPRSHSQPLPVYVLPGMRARVLAGVPRFQPGNKQSVARAFIRRPRDGRTWVLEDTLQYYLGLHEAPPVGAGPGRDPIVMTPPIDITTQDGISMNKCGLPDETPLWADTVYITGPRQDAIELKKRTGSDSLPELPARLECFNSDVNYNIEVYRARTTPGITVDTIVVEYHYDDPVAGRVDGIAKRPFTIIIEPRTSGGIWVEEEPAGTLTAIPNPAVDRIRFEWRSFSRKEAIGVRLFDALGRDVLGRPVAFELSGSVEIDISSLPAGTYRAVVEGREGDVLAVRSVMVIR